MEKKRDVVIEDAGRGERVVLLTFNDIYVLDPTPDGSRAGFAALAGMIERERRKALEDADDPAGAVIVCCCGDFMTAAGLLSGRGPADAGRHMVPLLAAAGVTHVVPGNHEFDRGTRGCALRSAESPFCWLCTNIDATRVDQPLGSAASGPMERPWTPSPCVVALDTAVAGRDVPFGAGVRADVVVTRRGHRVGLVGLCTPRVPCMSSAGDGGARFVSAERGFDDAIGVLRDLDAVVALTHMDMDEDVCLARHAGSRLHVILGGHEHCVIVDRADGRAPIVKCGSDADHLGRVVLRVGGSNGARVESIDLLPNRVDASVPTRGPDPVESRVRDLLTRLVASRPRDDVDPADMTADLAVPLCVFARPLTSATARSGPCSLADLFCDLLAQWADGDAGAVSDSPSDAPRHRETLPLALIQGGALRAARDYPAGHVFTAGDLRAEMATASRCTVRLLTGHQLKAAFENAVAQMPAPEAFGSQADATMTAESAPAQQTHCRSLLHVSAPWRMVYDPRRPPGRRVVSIHRGDVPLEPDSVHRVIMQQFVARGGDGFAMFVDTPIAESAIETVFMRRVIADGLLAAVDPDGVLDLAQSHAPRVVAHCT
ncbi:5' -nucleotidase [Pandoravirus kuranda]|uniref:5' -nucleotidase n=1 Tax=Pandoravirus kuranda TaxID=3019033 RepID=A0AA95J2I6_9VIRU|nr:5' -nucleotidase [Pandoravirus kuranda]